MSVSNSFSYNVNKQQLIRDALVEAGVIRDDQEVEGGMYDWMSRRLNGLLKQLQSKGLHLWKTRQATLLLEKGKTEYIIGEGSNCICVEDLVQSSTTLDIAVAATTYPLVSSSGISVGDSVGVFMGSGTIHWTTVTTVPDATSITVAQGPTEACANEAIVYSYTSVIPKPLRVHEAYTTINNQEGSHTILTIIPREEYMRLNSSSSSSCPIELYFNPEIRNSVVKVWPSASENTQKLVMTLELPIDDMNDALDSVAFPDWWFEAIHLKLAHAAARGYNVPLSKTKELYKDSLIAVKEAEDFNVETTYLQFVPTVLWYND